MASEMKCCGLSLRTTTLITLYINILVNICTLFRTMKFQHESAYRRIMGEEFEFGVNVILTCVEIGVFIAAIEALRKKKTLALKLTLSLVLLNIFIIICLMYKLPRAENAVAVVNQEARLEIEQFFGYFNVKFEYFYTIGELVMCCVWAVCLVFHLSSAAIVYKFQVELKESLIAEGPVSHHQCASSNPPPRYTVSPIEIVSPPPYSVIV